MRTVRFRGKRVDNNEWVFGFLTANLSVEPNYYFIKTGLSKDPTYVIDIKTICQLTGMLDISKKDIYDGDIVENYVGEKFVVEFDSYGFRTTGLGKAPISYPLSTWKQLEIIGNIHENPELLEAN